MLISSYISLPFGHWAYCQYPAVVEAKAFLGKIDMGSDILLWIGRLEIIVARDARKAAAWNPRSMLDRLSGLPRTLRPSLGRAPLASEPGVS